MSGLSRTPGKRVGANNPPRVRIPPSPPTIKQTRALAARVSLLPTSLPTFEPDALLVFDVWRGCDDEVGTFFGSPCAPERAAVDWLRSRLRTRPACRLRGPAVPTAGTPRPWVLAPRLRRANGVRWSSRRELRTAHAPRAPACRLAPSASARSSAALAASRRARANTPRSRLFCSEKWTPSMPSVDSTLPTSNSGTPPLSLWLASKAR